VRREIASRGISIINAMKHLTFSSVVAAAFSASMTKIKTKRNAIPVKDVIKPEAQLPQRNSTSAAHMEGGDKAIQPNRPCAPSGYITYMHMVESETRNKRTKRTLK